MPGLDRTGPEGEGPKTGRGMGKCNPNYKDDNETRENRNFRGPRGNNRGFRRRQGRGHGGGRFD